MSDIYRIESISQLAKGIGGKEPKHPLIYIMDVTKFKVPESLINQKIVSNFYTIFLKDADCGMIYGRNVYDFEEGVLSFTAPGQVAVSTNEVEPSYGWVLVFHPDLIRQSNLGKIIHQYNFFSYDVHEALHLSKQEEGVLNDCIKKIEYELDQNIDRHSQNLLISNLELLLNYCNRFYERQFYSRSNQNKDIISQIEQLIHDYYQSNLQLEHGTPSIQYLANEVNLSANYLSDLLKRETGLNAKEHINDFVVNLAKNRLLNSDLNISEIAYDLGFNYPHYFSRMFKRKTGYTPHEYRTLNVN